MSLEFNSWWFTENTFFFAYHSYTMCNTKLYICRTWIPCIANSMIFLRATRIAQNHIQYIHTTTCQTEKNFFEFKVIKSWLICDESWNKIAELASCEYVEQYIEPLFQIRFFVDRLVHFKYLVPTYQVVRDMIMISIYSQGYLHITSRGCSIRNIQISDFSKLPFLNY